MRRALAAVTLFVLAACGGSSALRTGGDSGIRGRAVLGPQCPVERVGTPCPDKPFQAEIQVVDQSGKVVTTVRAGGDGHFEVGLEPGRYVLEPVPPTPSALPFGKPVDVVVRAHSYSVVTVQFDTGIR